MTCYTIEHLFQHSSYNKIILFAVVYLAVVGGGGD